MSAAGAAGIGRGMRRRPAALAATLVCLAALACSSAAAPAATTRSCGSVRDPYPGTRYAGVDLSHITATGVSCRAARSVARGAHRKALGITPAGQRHPDVHLERLEGPRRPAPGERPLRRDPRVHARALALLAGRFRTAVLDMPREPVYSVQEHADRAVPRAARGTPGGHPDVRAHVHVAHRGGRGDRLVRPAPRRRARPPPPRSCATRRTRSSSTSAWTSSTCCGARPRWRTVAQRILFQPGDILEHGEEGEEAVTPATTTRPTWPSRPVGAAPAVRAASSRPGGSLGIGSLRGRER